MGLEKICETIRYDLPCDIIISYHNRKDTVRGVESVKVEHRRIVLRKGSDILYTFDPFLITGITTTN